MNRMLRRRKTAPESTSYKSMSKEALVKLARSRGINASSRWYPETIISYLEKADG